MDELIRIVRAVSNTMMIIGVLPFLASIGLVWFGTKQRRHVDRENAYFLGGLAAWTSIVLLGFGGAFRLIIYFL